MANLTRYAEKYGVGPQENSNPIFGPGKSGLTPLSPYNPFTSLNQTATEVREDLEAYQRSVFLGFTSRELLDLDVITSRQLREISINAPIHPIFGKDRWESSVRKDYSRQSLYTLPGKFVGSAQDAVWVAQNPVVWKTLEPSLRLASVMIGNLPRTPWFDALMMAERENIPLHRIPPEALLTANIDDLQKRHKIFRPRAPSKMAHGHAKIKMEALIRHVLKRLLTFDFMSMTEDPTTGKWRGRKLSGQFHIGNVNGDLRLYISLAYQTLMPLLSGQLDSAEKLEDQFAVAVTLVHEFLHAICYAAQNFDGGFFKGWDSNHIDRSQEPYFDTEQEDELGRSGEQAIFGGMIEAMHHSEEGKPHRAFAAFTFPQEGMNTNSRSNPRLISPKMTSEGFAIPMPVTFFENICSQSYWDVYVRRFGVEGGLKLSLAISAAVSQKIWAPPELSPPYTFQWRRLKDQVDYDLKAKLDASSFKSLTSMSPEQREEHAELMKRGMVANLHALFSERDEFVGDVVQSGEFLMINGQDETLYEVGINHLSGRLKDLFKMHLRIINHVPKVEARAGQDLPDLRSSIVTFHNDLRKYAKYFLDNSKEPGRGKMQKLLGDINNVDIADAFTPFPQQPATLLDESREELLLEEAKLALENGEEERSRNACLKITQNLNSSKHYLALARIQLAMIPSLEIGARISLLKLAVKIIDSLDMNTVPSHLSMNGVRGFAADLQKELDERQRAESGGLVCNCYLFRE